MDWLSAIKANRLVSSANGIFNALRKADNHDITDLIAFARS
jgi:hypothetical protein